MNHDDKYCATFKMFEMRAFLEMLNPYLDNQVKEQVIDFYETYAKQGQKNHEPSIYLQRQRK